MTTTSEFHLWGRVSLPRQLRRFAGVAVLLGFALAGSSVHAETFQYAPFQSAARPFGLDIAAPVQLAGSDAASRDFQDNTLPTLNDLARQYLPEYQAIGDLSQTGDLVRLDTGALNLARSADVRAYFVGEGAGHRNSVGFNTAGGGIQSGNPLLIFPNASSSVSYMHPGTGSGNRSENQPLLPGDFVDLGSFQAGTSFDFFLVSDGANPDRSESSKYVFSTDISQNRDGLDHVVAFAYADSPYLLLGFEDLLNGGDRDYNDVMFAVYVGEQNVRQLIRGSSMHGVPAPEPGLIWLLVAACGSWLYRVRRQPEAAGPRHA